MAYRNTSHEAQAEALAWRNFCGRIWEPAFRISAATFGRAWRELEGEPIDVRARCEARYWQFVCDALDPELAEIEERLGLRGRLS